MRQLNTPDWSGVCALGALTGYWEERLVFVADWKNRQTGSAGAISPFAALRDDKQGASEGLSLLVEGFERYGEGKEFGGPSLRSG